MKEYFKEIESIGLVNATKIAEEKILKMSNVKIKANMLCLISQLKFQIYYSDLLIQFAPNWDERYDNCMYNETNEIFEQGSWIEQAAWIAGLPGTFIVMAADCMYAATYTPEQPRCQNKL